MKFFKHYLLIHLLAKSGRVVHLCQSGLVTAFTVVHGDDDVEYWATDTLDASELDRTSFKDVGWNIDEYHRGIKQCCGSEKCQGRKVVVQRGHFFLALPAFLRLESYRLKSGVRGSESERAIHRSATTLFITQPSFYPDFAPRVVT